MRGVLHVARTPRALTQWLRPGATRRRSLDTVVPVRARTRAESMAGWLEQNQPTAEEETAPPPRQTTRRCRSPRRKRKVAQTARPYYASRSLKTCPTDFDAETRSRKAH